MSKTNRTVNGKMNKRDVVRGMWLRAFKGESSSTHSISYVARRLNLKVSDTIHFLTWMAKNSGCPNVLIGRTVHFIGVL